MYFVCQYTNRQYFVGSDIGRMLRSMHIAVIDAVTVSVLSPHCRNTPIDTLYANTADKRHDVHKQQSNTAHLST